MSAETGFASQDYSAYLVYYSLFAVFVVLIVAIFGMVFLSMGNKSKSVVAKNWCEDMGVAFIVSSLVLVAASFLVVPFFAKNDFYRTEMLNSSGAHEFVIDGGENALIFEQ